MLFTQSLGISASIITTTTATTTAATISSGCGSGTITTLPLLLTLLVWAAGTGPMTNVVAALDWKQVKPMYLVSMFPAQFDMQTSFTSSSSSSSSTSAEHDTEVIDGIGAQDNTELARHEREPLVLNLETTPLQESMMSEGAMAMDRIFGGNVGNPHCFPYQVGMLLQRPKGLYWCGGSLISDEFVLTAAHCVDMAKRALVFLGANEIKNAKEKGQVRLMVHNSNFIIYPTWNPKRLKDDIALVRLPHSVSFNERIHPIQLPKRHYEYRSFKNKLAIASGWGRYSTGVHAISNVLRYVQLQIIEGHTCKRNFPLSYRSTNICTSGRNAKSTCNGDSGGPLVLQRKHSKKRVLVGVTSFGSIYGCDRGYPAAFTKVASYLDWISDEAGVHPFQDTTEAIFFDKYVKNYDKFHKRRPTVAQSSELSDEPDDLDVFHKKKKPEVLLRSRPLDSIKREKDRFKPNSEYEFYFL